MKVSTRKLSLGMTTEMVNDVRDLLTILPLFSREFRKV
jgi:hypothetical protein